MPVIHKPDNKPLQSNAGLMVPARFVPSFRVVQSAERNCRNSLLFRMHGGLGDIVCAEPAVRYALKHFKDVSISLATLYPTLFQHLQFEKVFDEKNVHELKLENYLLYENTDTSNELAAEFLCHTLMHGIDYASLYMWRSLLPRDEREIRLVPNEDDTAWANHMVDPKTDVLIHPGKTWQSRTFPKKWWDEITSRLIKAGMRPVIIGGVIDQGRASTVEVETEGCLDLRHKCTLMQSVAMMHRLKVILTNDSAPLHMATTGDIWIGFLSTVKHPDHLYTYRTPTWLRERPGYNGEWAWRMKDHAHGGFYEMFDICPNKDKTIRVDNVDVIELLKWLPEPKALVDWTLEKMHSK